MGQTVDISDGYKVIDMAYLDELTTKNKGLTNQQLADLMSKHTGLPVSKVSIWKARQHLESDAAITAEYVNVRADLFASKQRMILDEITHERIKRMSDGAMTLWFNSLYNNERLERGQATSINVTALVDVLDTIRALRGE